ncbi:hypothetical protein [Leptospira interrogans]|uniref:hypothetical protein n=1 Tax=Leptospira interrogans TaxID=173 RepID=UPI000ADBDA89|nr:hypothetical protein [Leptospira interrogans]
MINFLNLYHFNVNIILLPLLIIMSHHEETGEEGLSHGAILFTRKPLYVSGTLV